MMLMSMNLKKTLRMGCSIMKQANLWITSGAPASGKSTAIENIFAFEPSVKVISRDVVRFKYLDKNPNADYFKFEKTVFKEFVNSIRDAFEAGYKNVVADATHLNERSRNKLISAIGFAWLCAHDISLNYIVMNTSLDECLRRNALRKGCTRVPEENLIDMYNRFEKPTFDEIFIPNKIYIINEDGAVEIERRRKH